MKTTHFNLLLVGILAAVGAIGYISFSTINYTSSAVDAKNDVVAETPAVTDDAAALPTTDPATVVPDAAAPVATATGKYTELSNEIQKLLDDNIQMKEGSKGTRVETVQKFLNIYDPAGTVTPNGVYGPTTKARTIKFQTEMGLPKSGYAGPKTYAKMIEWLKTAQ